LSLKPTFETFSGQRNPRLRNRRIRPRNEIIARDKGGGTFTATLQQYFCGGAPGVVEDARAQRRRPERSRSGQRSGEVGLACDLHDVAVAQLNEMCCRRDDPPASSPDTNGCFPTPESRLTSTTGTFPADASSMIC
jgi:hypothetical protein